MSTADLTVFIEAYNRLALLKSIAIRNKLLDKLEKDRSKIFEGITDKSKCQLILALVGMRSPPAQLTQELALLVLQNEKLSDDF